MTELRTKCITPRFIASYAQHVWTPQKDDNGVEKYSCALVFPEGTDLEEMKTCARNAIAKKFGAENVEKKLKQKGFKWPFREGDEKDGDPLYAGKEFVSATSFDAPGVGKLVGKKAMELTDKKEFYSGCVAAAEVNFFIYDKGVNKGVGCGLNSVCKVSEGTRIGGSAPVTEAFASYAEEHGDEEDVMA